MIIRIWKGKTTLENSSKYEQLLKEVVFPRIKAKNLDGYNGIQLLKDQKENCVDFITIMAFESLVSVKAFAGEEYEKSYVIDEAKQLLESYDKTAEHYELLYNTISFLE